MLKRNLVHSPIPPTHGLPKPGQDIPLWRDEDFTPDVGDSSSEYQQHTEPGSPGSCAAWEVPGVSPVHVTPQSASTATGLTAGSSWSHEQPEEGAPWEGFTPKETHPS